MHNFLRRIRKSGRGRNKEINPEDIFIDSANLPGLNRDRFEGRMESPIGENTFLLFKVALVLVFLLLSTKLWALQVSDGSLYKQVSEENRLSRYIIFSDRGVIFDRNSVPLAENVLYATSSDFALRKYPDIKGMSALVGYVKHPLKDSSGRYYDETYRGELGVEKTYNEILKGENGSKLVETDALGDITSESVVLLPKKGGDIFLSVDSRLNEKMYKTIESLANEKGFTGGAGVIMDVNTGEILALTSYPEYDQNLVAEGANKPEINKLLNDKRTPFLNRVVSGLYTPGSIVKPIVALGALNEGVIDPYKEILSTGALTLPNPYNPDKPSIFKDWKAHGLVDMRKAIAMSSDVYFYEVGGGFGTQKGLGITKLDEYFSLFGLNEMTGIDLPSESLGYIATPSWKEINFPDDPVWRVGNTYHTSIGQYGTQITPISAVRFVAAIANGGKMLKPSVLLGGQTTEAKVTRTIDLKKEYFDVVREGMRQTVTAGTASGLSKPEVKVAGKTGTAELGLRKEFVNAWVVGFFPYESPRYAFVVIMEKGPVKNTVGGVYVMRQVLDWMVENTPEYLN
ncbi:MAG TPA: penicillin-binding transpeptidase domain-containing protein [Parcubacteria group bacterium]|nr:penicillin-binding transpeptidase domain-containing protein [Parcubacteria group bacterium]